MADLVRRGERAIARRAQKTKGPLVEYLAFVLAGDVYAVPIGAVREILKPPAFTEVPRAPREVLGVVSVRGLLVTVVDLRRRLRLEESAPTRKSRILLAEGAGGELIGLLVDEVLQVHRLGESEIEVASSVLGGQLAEYVLGIGRPEGALLVLLDLRPIIGAPGA